MLLQPGSKPMKYKRIVSDLENAVTVQPGGQGTATVNGIALNVEVPGILLSVYKYIAGYDQGNPASGRIPSSAYTSITIDDTPLPIPHNVVLQTSQWYNNTAYSYSDMIGGDINSIYNRASNGGYLSYIKKQTIVNHDPKTYSWDMFPAYFYETSYTTTSYRLNIPFNKITITHAANSTTIGNPSSHNTVSVKSYLVVEYAVSE